MSIGMTVVRTNMTVTFRGSDGDLDLTIERLRIRVARGITCSDNLVHIGIKVKVFFVY